MPNAAGSSREGEGATAAGLGSRPRNGGSFRTARQACYGVSDNAWMLVLVSSIGAANRGSDHRAHPQRSIGKVGFRARFPLL